MRIKCLIIRPQGSIVDIEGTEYHFKPEENGDHVTNVDNHEHIDILLNIADAYVALDPLPERVSEPTPVTPTEPRPFPPVGAPESTEPTDSPPRDTGPETGETEPVLPSVGDGVSDALETAEPEKLNSELDEAEARAKYADIFNRAAHPNAKLATIVAKIDEAEAQAAGTEG